MGFQMSLFKSHKNSLSERVLEGKAVSLRDEITDTKQFLGKLLFGFYLRILPFSL